MVGPNGDFIECGRAATTPCASPWGGCSPRAAGGLACMARCSYTYEKALFLVPEVDGVRILSNKKCEFLQRVPSTHVCCGGQTPQRARTHLTWPDGCTASSAAIRQTSRATFSCPARKARRRCCTPPTRTLRCGPREQRSHVLFPMSQQDVCCIAWGESPWVDSASCRRRTTTSGPFGGRSRRPWMRASKPLATSLRRARSGACSR